MGRKAYVFNIFIFIQVHTWKTKKDARTVVKSIKFSVICDQSKYLFSLHCEFARFQSKNIVFDPNPQSRRHHLSVIPFDKALLYFDACALSSKRVLSKQFDIYYLYINPVASYNIQHVDKIKSAMQKCDLPIGNIILSSITHRQIALTDRSRSHGGGIYQWHMLNNNMWAQNFLTDFTYSI